MTTAQKVTVFGGGNTAFAVAANLSLRGHEITLFELPEFAASLEPVQDTGIINLVGVAEQGAAKIHRITSDVEEAIDVSDRLMLIAPLSRRARHI